MGEVTFSRTTKKRAPPRKERGYYTEALRRVAANPTLIAMFPVTEDASERHSVQRAVGNAARALGMIVRTWTETTCPGRTGAILKVEYLGKADKKGWRR